MKVSWGETISATTSRRAGPTVVNGGAGLSILSVIPLIAVAAGGILIPGFDHLTL